MGYPEFAGLSLFSLGDDVSLQSHLAQVETLKSHEFDSAFNVDMTGQFSHDIHASASPQSTTLLSTCDTPDLNAFIANLLESTTNKGISSTRATELVNGDFGAEESHTTISPESYGEIPEQRPTNEWARQLGVLNVCALWPS